MDLAHPSPAPNTSPYEKPPQATNPLNSLRFVLNELKKDKVVLNKDFYVFTGSTVGVVPILGKGLYTGKVSSLGSAKAIIY